MKVRGITSAWTAALLAVGSVTITVPVRAQITLARDGQAQCAIVFSATNQPVLFEAVKDLHDYLGKVTGADFAKATGPARLVILDHPPVNAPPALRTNREAFWIDARESEIRIAGGGPVGAAYGIYHFLEKYAGVRWFLPADDGEYVPKKPDLTIPPGQEFSQPAFVMRWVGTGAWALRNRCNPLTIGDTQLPDGSVVSAGYHFMPGIYHTQQRFLPVDKYFREHPDYFALVKGKRQNLDKATKLCTTNPALIKAMAESMGRYLDENPGVDIISLSPTDHAYYCTCEACNAEDEEGMPNAGRYSRRMVKFYSAVINELRRTHPQAKVCVGAYAHYTWPPKDTALELPPESYVVLAHYMPACLAHSVNDAGCKDNVQYNTILTSWLKQSSGVFFYEYYWKNNWFGLPWPIIHTLRQDIPYFQRIGVKGLFTQSSPQNAFTVRINYYIAAKLLWDPATDVDQLVEEYHRLYFAEAAGPMLQYHRAMENRLAAAKAAVPGGAWQNATAVYDSAFLAEMHAALSSALTQAKTEATRRRVSRHIHHLEYSRQLVAGLELLAKGDKRAGYDQIAALRQDVLDHMNQWEGILAQTDVEKFIGTPLTALRAQLDRKKR